MFNKRGRLLLKKNKKGQFFLIAAVVIIVVVVSIATISNYTQKKEVATLYDLGEELGIESQNVLDYGTYNGQSPEEISALMEQFIRNYHDYQEQDKNVYFVFGNKNAINFLGYQDVADESVCIKLNPTRGSACTTYYTEIETTKTYTTTGEINTVAVVITDVETRNSNQYEFRLKKGENFYFVIWQKIGEERHVVTSD
jgi:hypothetical protein